MGNLCIIPARGGSKRIPKKNIKDFLGKPIIAYSVETALASNLFDEVMVSTDDIEVAEVAKKFGAKVPFMRSVENSDDFASTMDVILEVINDYNSLGITYEYFCCLYPTAPLASIKNIREGFEKLINEKKDSVFPVVAFSYPVWRGLRISKDGNAKMIWPLNQNKRSQDLETVYHDAGQWYWFNKRVLNSERKLFTDNTSTIVLSELEVQDIDTEVDWKLAELKYEIQKVIK